MHSCELHQLKRVIRPFNNTPLQRQVRYTSMQECLHSAEEAAAAAVTECASLVGLVQW